MSEDIYAAMDRACNGLVDEVASMIRATPDQRCALAYAEAEMRNRLASIDIPAALSQIDSIGSHIGNGGEFDPENGQGDELLDAGSLFSPRHASLRWQPKPGQCRADVYNRDSGFFSYQCTRKAKVTREVIYHGQRQFVEYCGLHDPVAVKAKKDAQREKWEAEAQARAELAAKYQARQALEAAAIAALEQIAAGHNDPRGLAQQILKEHSHD